MIKSRAKTVFFRYIKVAIIILVAVAYFQNCSPVNFNQKADRQDASSGLPGATEQTKLIQVQQSDSGQPFKLLMIIDDSFTMSQSQAQISANIDSLLAPLKGLDVDVKVITTTANISYASTTFEFTKTDGSKVVKYASGYGDPTLLPEYLDVVNFPGFTATIDYGGADGNIFQLKSSDSSAATDNKINQLKNHILSLGTAGSDSETVFCPLLRELGTNQKSFFKAGDRTAVVVLSDEDDSSTSADCSMKRKVNYKIQNSAPRDYDRYSFDLKAVRATFSYKKIRPAVYNDGILVRAYSEEVLTDGYALVDWSAANEADMTAGTCLAKAQNFIRAKGLKKNFSDGQYMADMDFSNSVVTSCQLENLHKDGYDSFYVYSDQSGYGTDLCNLNNKINNYSLNQHPNVLLYRDDKFRPSGSSFYMKAGYNNNCAKENKLGQGTSSDRVMSGTAEIYLDSLSATSTKSEFDGKVLQKMQNDFGQNYFVSFIINPGDNSCTLKTNQSVGQRYQAAANANPDKVKVFPICASSYQPALSEVSNFIAAGVVTVYPLNLPVGTKIISVHLIRGGNSTQLNSSDYTIQGNEIGLKISLLFGDQIEIKYSLN